jgi:hypothetical protein
VLCGDSLKIEQATFQLEGGGVTPTSPLQLLVKVVNRLTARNFYKKWHYLGDTGFVSTINYGAYYEGLIQGVISFGSPNATELNGYFDRYNQEGWWEIKRLAMTDDCIKNSESRFIAIAVKLLRKCFNVIGIVTYADDGVGHRGIIYKASGFKYLGLTDVKKDFWVNGRIKQRGKTKNINGEWRDRSRKHLFIKAFYEANN